LTLHADAPAVFTDVWIEREDRAFVRPGRGFSVPERDEQGRLFRWIAPVAGAVAYVPSGQGRLTIEGWIPTDYYDLPLTLTVDWEGRPLARLRIRTPHFRVQGMLDAPDGTPWGELTFRASQSFVPDNRQRNGDHRSLAVRIWRMALE
jgi:hypothetical protein